MSDHIFDLIEQAVRAGGAESGFDLLAQRLREDKNYPLLFEARVIEQRYKMGDLVKGKIVKLASFGAFIELPDKLEGLVHISQISEEHVDKIKNVLKVGDEVTARVIKVDVAERRIGLSIKAANYSSEQLEAEKEQYEAALKPGEAIVDLEHAFEQAEEEKNQ